MNFIQCLLSQKSHKRWFRLKLLLKLKKTTSVKAWRWQGSSWEIRLYCSPRKTRGGYWYPNCFQNGSEQGKLPMLSFRLNVQPTHRQSRCFKAISTNPEFFWLLMCHISPHSYWEAQPLLILSPASCVWGLAKNLFPLVQGLGDASSELNSSYPMLLNSHRNTWKQFPF